MNIDRTMYVTLCGGLRKNPTPFHNATLLCMGFPTGYSESMPFQHLLHWHYTDKKRVFYVTPLGTSALSVMAWTVTPERYNKTPHFNSAPYDDCIERYAFVWVLVLPLLFQYYFLYQLLYKSVICPLIPSIIQNTPCAIKGGGWKIVHIYSLLPD